MPYRSARRRLRLCGACRRGPAELQKCARLRPRRGRARLSTCDVKKRARLGCALLGRRRTAGREVRRLRSRDRVRCAGASRCSRRSALSSSPDRPWAITARTSVAHAPDGSGPESARGRPFARSACARAAQECRRRGADSQRWRAIARFGGRRDVAVGREVGSGLHGGGKWGRVGRAHGHASRNPGGRAPPTQPPGFRFRLSA